MPARVVQLQGDVGGGEHGDGTVLLGLPHRRHRLLVASHRRKVKGVQDELFLAVRVEGGRLPVRPFGGRPVPLVPVVHRAKDRVGIGEVRVQRQCRGGCRLGLRHGGGRRREPQVQRHDEVTVGEAGVRERERRVGPRRLREELDRAVDPVRREFGPEEPPLHVDVVRFHVVRGLAGDLRLLVGR